MTDTPRPAGVDDPAARPSPRFARATARTPARLELEARWLHLTRTVLPALAEARGWPVRADHCFQRILLDVACGGCWYDHVAGRPAYAHTDDAILARAVTLGEAALAGTADLTGLNGRSLGLRRQRRQASGT